MCNRVIDGAIMIKIIKWAKQELIKILSVLTVIDKGKDEAYNSELHNLQTGVMAMLADSNNGILDSGYVDINDMDLITADNSTFLLNYYSLTTPRHTSIASIVLVRKFILN